jgi:microcin C transport system substrate-binding protein
MRFMLLMLALTSLSSQAQTIKENIAFAVIGEPKYAVNFTHFDYVNPAAPKGGKVTLSATGTFDNFNRFALRGVAARERNRFTIRSLSPLMMSPAATIR